MRPRLRNPSLWPRVGASFDVANTSLQEKET
jgi:hypothetical protein